MNKIWITQVFKFLSGLFWANEEPFEVFPDIKVSLKDNWIIGLYKYRNKEIRNAVWQMKYRANRKASRFFGQKMAKILIECGLENYVLVPIPIHWRRRLERGFNQSEWLCKEINNSQKNIKFEKILKRVIYSQKQSWNNRAARQKNINSVFKVKIKFKKYLIGKKILLIDDVVTTGATLKEARQEILIHGATSVRALTIAY
jgi:competence protein ComFC